MASCRRLSRFFAVGVLGVLAACTPAPSPSVEVAPKVDEHAVAVVNGHVIRDDDVSAYIRTSSHDEQETPQRRKNALEVIVRQELAAQAAEEAGLDGSEAYQAKVRQLQAQVDELRRRELSAAWYRRAAKEMGASDDVAAYYEANKAHIRTELHVLQILRRSEAEIEQARVELGQGASFEEVAARPYAKLPAAAGTPWDVGFLKWSQVPEPWQETVYDMDVGAVSGVLRGANGRFWILQLVERRDNPEATFEVMRPVIEGVLAGRRDEAVRAEVEKELRRGAQVEYMPERVAAPQP